MSNVALAAGDGGGREGGRSKLAGKTPAEVVKSALAAGLPAELGSAVLAVTGKTKLWNRERTDVARELCGHFFDGLEDGDMPSELLRSFGDPKRSARLITRAKRRNRPWAWRAMKRTVQAFGALVLLLVVFYGWSWARFYTGRPTITFNVQAEMNAPALAVPPEKRAWPLYRDATREMYAAKFNERVGQIEGWPTLKPGTKEWDEACAVVDSVRPSVEKVKRATAMERSACIVTSKLDDPYAGAPQGDSVDPNDNPIGLGVLLPQLSIYRSHARLLTFEMLRAAHEGRSADAAVTVEQMLSLGGHSTEDGTLIGQLVSLAVAQLTFDTLNAVVRDNPSLFTDAQLQRLAHAVASYTPRGGRAARSNGSAWTPDLWFERRSFEDLLQRFYTDDGDGDGRLCEGMFAYFNEFGVVEPKAAKALSPLLASVVAGRKETHDLYNRLMDRAEAENAKPRYLRDSGSLEREIDDATKGGLRIRNSLVSLMVPAIGKIGASFDITHTLRDATAAGLAIELYRRHNGRYPGSWDELVPSMIPAAPVDPWSGRALGFKAGAKADERPLIYSIGADKKDDGGKINTPWDVISAWASPTVPTIDGPISTGDWVIWPKPEPVGERPQAGPAPPIGQSSTRRAGFQWGWVGSLVGGN